eukprot:m.75545 g.75545  ORF g.75545 m.75545 type:complete len:163 (+) comp13988_c0_seq1:541-1029(+)
MADDNLDGVAEDMANIDINEREEAVEAMADIRDLDGIATAMAEHGLSQTTIRQRLRELARFYCLGCPQVFSQETELRTHLKRHRACFFGQDRLRDTRKEFNERANRPQFGDQLHRREEYEPELLEDASLLLTYCKIRAYQAVLIRLRGRGGARREGSGQGSR